MSSRSGGRGALGLALCGLAGFAAAPPTTALAQEAPMVLPVDVETSVQGIAVACTGIGAAMRDAPRWKAYGVRIEFSNALNEYVVGGVVRVQDRAGRDLLYASCDAPWVLLKLPPGAYRVEGRLPDAGAKPRSARFSPPARGQLRVVLQFSDISG